MRPLGSAWAAHVKLRAEIRGTSMNMAKWLAMFNNILLTGVGYALPFTELAGA